MSEHASSGPLLSIRQVAHTLGLSEGFVRTLCLRGDLASMKFGRAWRVSPEAVESFKSRRRWIVIKAAPVAKVDRVAARFDRARRETA